MLSNELRELYDGYYDEKVQEKRALSARDSMRELKRVSGGRPFERLLDVGAGEGAVLHELEQSGFAEKISVVEISDSGIEAIRERGLSTLESIQKFDGYSIPHPEKSFDVSLATYVLEHVEHERLFLKELARVSQRVIIAVPLEHTLQLRKAREAGKAIGHINFYTPETFRSVLETSGLEVENLFPYTTSRQYESFVSPKLGPYKYFVRKAALKIAPRLACSVLTYMAIAMCKCPE